MDEIITKAINKITSLQPKEQNHAWMVGEQLKDFCRASSHDADLIFHDLDIPEMSLEKAERKLGELAKKKEIRSGNIGTSCIMPSESEDILRKFYHLSPRGERPPEPVPQTAPAKSVSVNLDDFL